METWATTQLALLVRSAVTTHVQSRPRPRPRCCCTAPDPVYFRRSSWIGRCIRRLVKRAARVSDYLFFFGPQEKVQSLAHACIIARGTRDAVYRIRLSNTILQVLGFLLSLNTNRLCNTDRWRAITISIGAPPNQACRFSDLRPGPCNTRQFRKRSTKIRRDGEGDARGKG